MLRSDMLNDMAEALTENPDRNLMFAPRFAGILSKDHQALREVVAMAALNGIVETHTPVLLGALAASHS